MYNCLNVLALSQYECGNIAQPNTDIITFFEQSHT